MRRVALVLAFGALVALAACRAKPEGGAPSPADASAATAPPPASLAVDGKKLVTDDCQSCHADEMLQQQRLTSAQWAKVVAKMTTWGSPVEPENASALVAYLASHYGPDAGLYVPSIVAAETAAAAIAPEDDGPYAGGDATRGKALFVSTCAACHGLGARGQLGVNLVDRAILYRANDVATMVREGRGRMAPLRGVTDAQIADVLAYLRGVRGA
jgi:mono/diheme cytochrome c family protein